MARVFKKRKNASAISVIGGADGPTSIFIAGKSKKKSLIEKIRRRSYLRKKKKAAASIRAGAHTFEEVVLYLKKKYGAVEKPKDSVSYQEEYKCVKESLILRYQPELLGELAVVLDLKGRNKASIQELLRQTEARSKAAQAISDKEFPLDFHIYRVSTKTGTIEFSMERRWGLISCSYSGKKEEMKKLNTIYKDVYLYYGVSEEDICNQTERFQELVNVLVN
jgi:Na+-transporting methylmalonyl-CoA/oxaloacetate decarboxylase, beta subunit